MIYWTCSFLTVALVAVAAGAAQTCPLHGTGRGCSASCLAPLFSYWGAPRSAGEGRSAGALGGRSRAAAAALWDHFSLPAPASSSPSTLLLMVGTVQHNCVFFLRYPETNCKDKIRRDLKAVCCTGCASQPGSVGHGEVLQLYYWGWVSFAFKIQLLEEIKNELEVMNLTFEMSHLQGKNTWEKIRRFLIFFFLRTCRLQVFPLLLDEFCSCTIQTENYHRGLWSECSSAVLPGDWQQ